MSIEGYSNAYSNNIEGNSTDSILQAEIDLLQYNTTDITFDGSNKTTINNDLTITGVLAIPSFSNVGTTLTSLNSSVSTINTTLTGISYSNAGSIDLTTIDNNVTIGTGKTLSIPNFTNVETTLSGINTTLTGFSYLNTSGQDLTTISNNVTIGTGKVLNIDNYLNVGSYLDLILFNIDHIVNESTYTAVYDDFTIADGYKLKVSTFDDVGATLTSLTTTLTDISYSTDTTTINNNLVISTSKVLSIEGYSNVKTALDTINTTLTDISYSTDTTTINNNLTVSTSKILSIQGYSNVKSTLDSLTSSIDTINTTVSTLPTPMSNKIWEDEFLDGFNNNIIVWTSSGSGTSSTIAGELHHPGIVRLSCGNGDNRSIFPLRQSLVNFFWDDITQFDCIFRITGNENFVSLIGIYDQTNASQNILLSFDTFAGSKVFTFKVNDTVIANLSTMPFTSEHWMRFSFTNLGGKYVSVILKDLTSNTNHTWTSSSAITTIDTTGEYNPIVQIDISDNPAKYLDVDYISIQYKTNRN